MINNIIISFILLFIVFSTQSSAQFITASQADDSAQAMRTKASQLFGKDNASPIEISEGINILRTDLRFLDSSPIYDLAHGNAYLKSQKQNIYFNMAEAFCIGHQTDSAMCYLEKMFEDGTSFDLLSFIVEDSVRMKSIKSNMHFLALTNKLKRQRDLYNVTAFKTAYKPKMTEEEKIAGLSLLWSQAKYNFVYFDHIDIDWNKSYLEYLPKIKAAKTTAEYYKVLQTFYAQLKDGHSNVYFPKELSKDLYARPPIRTELIEGKVFIIAVFSDSLKKAGILPGLEILKIDSQPVIEYAEKNIKPYQSSSTPQDMEIREFSYALLAGPEKKPLVLALKDHNGKIFSKTISRSGYNDTKPVKDITYETIGNIGYLVINNFENESIGKRFDSLFPAIMLTKGLIIDIRNNGGGNGNIGYNIIKKLVDKPFKISASKRLQYISEPGEEVEWTEELPHDIYPDGSQYYSKPVVLLVGARTFSAAEDFAMIFDYIKRGKLIGQPTGGSTGQPISFDLPGGGTARVCGKRDTYPDGKEFVGIGIIPDIVITPTISDLENNTDAAKNKAVELLNSK